MASHERPGVANHRQFKYLFDYLFKLSTTKHRALLAVLWGKFTGDKGPEMKVQYIPRNMHTVFALLYFVVVIHWLIYPYPSGLLHWHCGNLMIAPVPAKQPWWIWINTSFEFIINDYIITTKQSTTKPCAYFLGYTVAYPCHMCFVVVDGTGGFRYDNRRFHWWHSSLQWRNNEHRGVSNHQRLDCLLNRLFSHRPKKTPKLRTTGLCEGNSVVTVDFPAQRVSNAENVSTWWRHHVILWQSLVSVIQL